MLHSTMLTYLQATGAGGRLGRMGRRYVQANGGGGQPALPPGGGQYPARHPPY